MDPKLWNQVISRLDPRDRRLRDGLTQVGLSKLEASIGLRLPEGYRTFLQAHDGGWIGDQKIYGSPEIQRLLELGRDRFRGHSNGTCHWQSFEAPYKRLLPIHPASSLSVECLSLDRADRGDGDVLRGSGLDCEDEAAIYWVRFGGPGQSASWIDPMEEPLKEGAIIDNETITGIRDIDVDVLTWSQVMGIQDDLRHGIEDPEIEPTYVDFLDWTLDAILEAEGRKPRTYIGPAQSGAGR